MPWYPSQQKDKVKHGYISYSHYDKVIADYLQISVLEVGDLDFITWLCYRYDAVVYNLSQHEEGRKHLENAWILEQKNPDRKKIRDQIRGSVRS